MSAGAGDRVRKESSGTGGAASRVSGSSASNLTPAPSSERISRSTPGFWNWGAGPGMMSAAESTNVNTSEYTGPLEMGLIFGGGGGKRNRQAPRGAKVALAVHLVAALTRSLQIKVTLGARAI